MKTIAFAFALIISLSFASAKPPKNFRTENLVAWCIVPYDAKKDRTIDSTDLVSF
jgi:hypothetical protein|tara:strand:- start:1838 stop:2002 length:165 start_codon:yes stop_codon:yes gene_type:complete